MGITFTANKHPQDAVGDPNPAELTQGVGRPPYEHRRPRHVHIIAAVIAAALAALSIAMAAPAGAHGLHHGDHVGPHKVASAVHPQHHSGVSGVAASVSTHRAAAGPAAGDPRVSVAGHNKCKRAKNNQVPPWCTDPAAGWGSSLHRAEASFPTLSHAKATSTGHRGHGHGH